MSKYRACRSHTIHLEGQVAELGGRCDALASHNEALMEQYEAISGQMQGDDRAQVLERLLAEREAELGKIRTLLSDALYDFQGKGVEVCERGGVVYISMQDKLLFESGKSSLAPRGVNAVERIGVILSQNSGFNITVEGHTDNKGYIAKPEDQIRDNWDLSTKRATEVVRVMLRGGAVDPRRIIASGRAEYLPVAGNNDEQGRSLNRRTEIMITPRFDRIMELLNQ